MSDQYTPPQGNYNPPPPPPPTPGFQYQSQGFPPHHRPGPNPGKTLGVVGMILAIAGFPMGFIAYLSSLTLAFSGNISSAIVFAFVVFLMGAAGLGLSIAGKLKSSKAGFGNGMALSGIIMSPFVILWSFWLIFICYQMREVSYMLRDEGISNSSIWDERDSKNAFEDALEDAFEDLEDEESLEYENDYSAEEELEILEHQLDSMFSEFEENL